jgi:hypothetical protein
MRTTRTALPLGLALLSVACLSARAARAPARPVPMALINAGHIDPADFRVNGVAQADTGGIVLTPSEPLAVAGSAFLEQRIKATAFRADFRFRITPGQAFGGEDSADGLTFAIAKAPDAIGGDHAAMGLEHFEPGGFAVEFDTWKNTFDPDGNHVGLDLNASVQSVSTAPVPTPFDDGQAHEASIRYEATSAGGHVTVLVDGQVYLDVTDPRVEVPDGHYGFTAANGQGTAEHRIESFRLVVTAPVSTPGGRLLGRVRVQSDDARVRDALIRTAIGVTRRGQTQGFVDLRGTTQAGRLVLRLKPDALVVNDDETATVYARDRSGTPVRLDVPGTERGGTLRLMIDGFPAPNVLEQVHGRFFITLPGE